MDSRGLHFVCVACGHRNIVINQRGADGPHELVRPDDKR
jgi:hypothetical protein